MESTRTRSALDEASRRTNSLAFAKNDCHTCKALKKICDRQRPRCGTCLSSGRRCDGFVMPLVWKGTEMTTSFSSRGGDSVSSQHHTQESRANTDFKFVQGRPKRKRKSRINSVNKAAQNQGYFSVAAIDYGNAPPALPDSIVEHRISEEVAEDVWNIHSAAVPTPIDTLNAIGTSLQHENHFPPNAQWDESESVSTICSDIAVFERIEQVERSSFYEIVLPPAILYQDLAQKYHNVLEMCKIP
jgi:hypothetical protein